MSESESYHPQKGPYLRDMLEGDRFIGYYVLRTKHLEPFRDASKGYYLTLALGDRTGQMQARVWENAEATAEEVHRGDIVKVDGETEIFQERLQIRVLRIRTAPSGEYDLRDMLPSSPRDPQEMQEELTAQIAKITDPHLSALVGHFFNDPDFMQHFSQAPAAKQIHHAYLHGLLEHCLEVLVLAETLTKLYPAINPDLLITGALFHDIGKVREYNWEFDIDFTDEGRLIGHIALGDQMLSEALQSFPDFPPDLGLRLRHMLLSHHGRYRWGSPRRPQTLEAIALHQIENMSAQIHRFHSLLEKRPSGEDWTDYDRLLRRTLYGGRTDDEEEGHDILE